MGGSEEICPPCGIPKSPDFRDIVEGKFLPLVVRNCLRLEILGFETIIITLVLWGLYKTIAIIISSS